MMDEFDLPPLPNAPQQALPSLLRKRTRSDYDDDATTSSDPAFFSGDEQNPGAENYASKRKKSLYQGSWWNHQLKVSKGQRKREFTRNYDSGIFMGSDGSDTAPSSDSLGLEEELLEDQRVKERLHHSVKPLVVLTNPASGLKSREISVYTKELSQARTVIQICLDQGREDVDLSSLGLSSLPTEIADLQALTKQTNIVEGMLDTGASFEVELRLYLANNLFIRVPKPILNLTNMRVLSLRQNNLTKIPYGIRSLVNLQTLNVSGNELQYLPFEVLELIRFHNLRHIIADPNPWLEKPDHSHGSTVILAGKHCPKMTRLCIEDKSLKSTSSQVPALVETVLRQIARIEPREDLVPYMPPSTSQIVVEALKTQQEAQEEGGRCCASCKRLIVLPGMERIEWWTISQPDQDNDDATAHQSGIWQESRVPYLRMQCCKSCDGKEADWCQTDK